MSNSLIYVNPSSQKTPEDATLSNRIATTLKTQQRRGWHEVFIAVRSGQVTLSGVVASSREQKLIISLVTKVPGVIRVKDELTVDEKYQERSAKRTADDSEEYAEYEYQQKAAKRAEQLRQLPVVSESLEDLLAARTNPTSR